VDEMFILLVDWCD